MPGTRTMPDPLNAYELARLADCASPDKPDSPGAKFLESVQDGAREAVADYLEDAPADMDGIDSNDLDEDGRLHEIADNAPDVYTYTRWLEFVDLAAWQEDPADLGGMPDDLTTAAGVCLYLIASRLVHALTNDLLAAIVNADADDES